MGGKQSPITSHCPGQNPALSRVNNFMLSIFLLKFCFA
jgi:hypothetical protein